MDLNRPVAPSPYDLLPAPATFTLESNDMTEGQPIPDEHTATRGNVSPHLAWHGFPEETKGFVVTCFDPDAPTGSGFWHWTIVDLDASVTELEKGQGESDLFLPDAASHVRGDSGIYGWYGPNPPSGDRPHRYIFAVHAIDEPALDIDPGEVSPAVVGFNLYFHTIARATLEVTYQQ